MPSRARALGRQLQQIGPVEHDRRRTCAGSSPMMHLSSVVLPMPLRPIRHVREPCGTVEIDVPQRVAAAVELVERLDRQHAHAPR